MIEIHRGKFNEAKLTRSIMHQDRKWENSAINDIVFEIWNIISRLKINNFWKFSSLLPAFLGPLRIEQSYQRIRTVFEIYFRTLCNNAAGRSSSLILTLILWITLSKWNLRIEFNLKVITARNEISITTIMNHYSTTKKDLPCFPWIFFL